MKMQQEINSKVKTLVLTCTDLFHPFIQQPHHIVFRVACNCVAPHNTAALQHLVREIQKYDCTALLIVGHDHCSALMHNVMQTLTHQHAGELPYRVGRLLNSIVEKEPALSADKVIAKVAAENVKQEISNLKSYFATITPPINIKISGAIINSEDEFIPVESKVLIA